MKLFKNFTILLFFLSISIPMLYGEENIDLKNIFKSKYSNSFGADCWGKEFWLSVPPSYAESGDPSKNIIKLLITSPVKTQVTVEVAGKLYSKNKMTIPNDVIEFNLSQYEAQPFSKGWSDAPPVEQIFEGAGIHIYADDMIMVYLLVRFLYTTDGALILPANVLGKEYIVSSYNEDPLLRGTNDGKIPSMAVIVAAYDNTSVKFTMGGTQISKTVGGLKPGEFTEIILNKGDVWAFSTNESNHDLSGSKITSTKPVGVLSGNFCADIPIGIQYCDYIVEMETPTNTWGKYYIVPQVPNRKLPNIIRIYAKEPETKIFRNGNEIGTITSSGGIIGKGWLEMRLVPIEWTPQSAIIYGDKPISVTEYNTGSSEESSSQGIFDPFSCKIMPLEQNPIMFTFFTPYIAGGVSYTSNYLNLIYQTDKSGDIPDDLEYGELVASEFKWSKVSLRFSGIDEALPFKINNNSFKVKTISVSGQGVYKIRSGSPVFGYIFGGSMNECYGFPASGVFRDLSINDTLPPLPVWEMDCLGNIINANVTDMPTQVLSRSNLSLIAVENDSSYNYNFQYDNFSPGSAATTSWGAQIKDPKKEARLVVAFTDRNGNDTTIIIQYHPVKLRISPKNYNFNTIKSGDIATSSFWLINESSGAVEIKDLKIKSNSFEILDLKPTFKINAYDSIRCTIRFTAKGTEFLQDSLVFSDSCNNSAGAMVYAESAEPVINVTDINFYDVPVGTHSVKQVMVRNTGKVPLKITGFSHPDNSCFKMDSAYINLESPIFLNSTPLSFSVTFTPTEATQYNDSIVVHSDAKQLDSVITLTGSGNADDVFELGNNNKIRFYPNPCDTKLFITIDNSLINKENLIISDILGNSYFPYISMENGNYSSNIIINTAGLNTGIYFLKFFNKNKINCIKFSVIH
jgi:hypothetical protein